ncbi:DUF359 domain-containing protein [Ignisphaera sp. 4213-co]|uniref:DUF359 domain-containing protein n=1 Tax=Ignisphaera cupida TaxID=3050454 RepID=A0ABD4Z6Y7_9CREN|nr:DUF359 domain-containing protein [Ignisphaera sp. 4213-co]MDK6029101.1 DUF359 domain-containing protein [Ignisphaera sp. 4213-co]
MIIYRMPDDLRKRLSAPHTYNKNLVVIKGPREYVAMVLRSIFYDKLHEVYVVGDYTCETFLLYIGIPRMCIVDGNIMRKPYEAHHTISKYFENVARCCNPRGAISSECIDVIRKALSIPKSLVVVDGEEDLLGLVLQSILLRGYVIYGLPHEGVAIADVLYSSIEAINLFAKFQLQKINNFLHKEDNFYDKL